MGVGVCVCVCVCGWVGGSVGVWECGSVRGGVNITHLFQGSDGGHGDAGLCDPCGAVEDSPLAHWTLLGQALGGDSAIGQ